MLGACLVVAGCGGGSGTAVDPNEAVLQISSEGGFMPMEMALAGGPRYTLLGDGSLIYMGLQTMQFPGPLVPPYLVAQLDDNQVNAVMAMVEDMGLAEVEDETDDSAMATVADAATDAIRLWDENGEHRYAVYALGIEEEPSERNAVFAELIATFDQFTSMTDGEPYVADQVRVIAGPAFIDPSFTDTREWPLESTDLSEWQELPVVGWRCTVIEGPVPEVFDGATQATAWENPDGGEPLQLLVRPLLPGEDDCPPEA